MAFVYGKFTGARRVYLDIFSEVLVVLTAVLLLIYGGYIMAYENTNQVTASLGVNMGLVYAVLPLSGIIITIYGVLNLADMFKKLKSPDLDTYGVNAE